MESVAEEPANHTANGVVSANPAGCEHQSVTIPWGELRMQSKEVRVFWDQFTADAQAGLPRFRKRPPGLPLTRLSDRRPMSDKKQDLHWL